MCHPKKLSESKKILEKNKGFFSNFVIAGHYVEYVLSPEVGVLQWRRQTNKQTDGHGNPMTDPAQGLESVGKLDRVGPVDKRPSTNKLHHFVQKKNM